MKKFEHVRYGVFYGDQLTGDVISNIKQASSGDIKIHFTSDVTVKAEVVDGHYPRMKYFLIIAFTTSEQAKLITVRKEVEQHQVIFSGVKINFLLKWSYFDRLHKGLDNLSLATINRIVPVCASDFTSTSGVATLDSADHYVHKIIQLDESQEDALNTIMNCQANKAPVLVVGSFGTGKTRLLARAAYQILHEDTSNRVLICAHHQHSADTFIYKYFVNTKSVHAVRLVPLKEVYNIQPGFCEYFEGIKDFSLKHDFHKLIIVTTFSTAIKLLQHPHYVHKGYFTHILLDESAQSREPELIAPLCLADQDTKIVIAGDHKQVSDNNI